jgi:hypothetical protein
MSEKDEDDSDERPGSAHGVPLTPILGNSDHGVQVDSNDSAQGRHGQSKHAAAPVNEVSAPSQLHQQQPASPARVSTLQLAYVCHFAAPDKTMDHPDYPDFDNLGWYQDVMLCCCMSICFQGAQLVITYPLLRQPILVYFVPGGLLPSIWPPGLQAVLLVTFVLNSLLIDVWRRRRGGKMPAVFRFYNFVATLLAQFQVSIFSGVFIYLAWSLPALYIVGSFAYRIIG